MFFICDILGKRQLKEGSFPGKQVILDQIENKPPRRRVGLVLKSGIARSHAKVYAKNSDTLVGEITSGSFSPLRKKGIAMAYVKKVSFRFSDFGIHSILLFFLW